MHSALPGPNEKGKFFSQIFAAGEIKNWPLYMNT